MDRIQGHVNDFKDYNGAKNGDIDCFYTLVEKRRFINNLNFLGWKL